jgi:mannose-6-phosphate isomerase-like protein (cupin superfamily)
LLYAHGNHATQPIFRAVDLLHFADPLIAEIRHLIESHGMILVGSSLSEVRLVELVPSGHNIWYVDPIPVPPAVLAALGVKETQVVAGDDARFDNFMQGLAKGLLTHRYSGRLLCDAEAGFRPHRKTIDALVSSVREALRTDRLDEADVESRTTNLFKDLRFSLKKAALSSEVCVVFLNDANSPGGYEIQSILNRTSPMPFLNGIDTYVMDIRGRVGVRSDDRLVIGTRPEFPHNRYRQIVLVDDVAFSGNTLRLAQRYLIQECGGTDCQFIAAVLRVDAAQREQLTSEGWTVHAAESHDGLVLHTPWGPIRPTRPVYVGAAELSRVDDTMSPDTLRAGGGYSFIPKPWGDLLVMQDNVMGSTRVLDFAKGQSTSFHYHLLRDETLVPLDDAIIIKLWDRFVRVARYQSVTVPAGVPHALLASETHCRVLECSSGLYEQQWDIVRIEDRYGRRAGSSGDDGII